MTVVMRYNFAGVEQFRRAIHKAGNAGLTQAAYQGATQMIRGMGAGPRWQGSLPGMPPNVQRGFLRNSIGYVPSRNLRSAAGATARHAIVHEFGATITAKRVKYLPIPVNVAARRLLEQLGGRSLRTQNMQIRRGRNGTLLLVGRSRVRAVRYVGNGRKVDAGGEPVFVLRRSLVLPPRPWARPAVFGNPGPIVAAFQDAAVRSLRAVTP